MPHNDKPFKIKLGVILIIFAVCGLLFFTNPTMDQYEQYVQQQLKEVCKHGELSHALGMMLGGVASHLVADASLKNDYFLWSIFEVEFGDNRLRSLGVLDHFITLDTLESLGKAKPKSLSTNSKQNSLTFCLSEQTEADSNNKSDINSIQREFKTGPIIVSTYSKCSPLMEDCKSFAVLHIQNQSLKIESVGWSSHPLKDDEVSLVDNRFVAIGYGNGGNCSACEGIAVAGFDDGKLFYLGRFHGINNGNLFKLYDVLERNMITNHANSPGWRLYFKLINNKAVFDLNLTCQSAKVNYEKDKSGLLAALNTSRVFGMPKEQTAWSEENIISPLFRTLALARYCGWKNEYLEILKAVKSDPRQPVTWKSLEIISGELSKVEQPQSEL